MSQANQRRMMVELGGVITFTVSNVKQFCLLSPIHTADADETKLSSLVRRRCVHEFATSCRQFRRVVGVNSPVGSRDPYGCVVRSHRRIRRQSSRIHVHTADADATRLDSFVSSAVCIGLKSRLKVLRSSADLQWVPDWRRGANAKRFCWQWSVVVVVVVVMVVILVVLCILYSVLWDVLLCRYWSEV